MKISHFALFFISCMILGLSVSACDCSRPTAQEEDPSKKIPPQDPALKKLDDALATLNESITGKNASADLTEISGIIRAYGPYPQKPITDTAGNPITINRPTNGRELFDNLLIATKLKTQNTDKAVKWMIEKGVLGINEPDKQGVTPLQAATAAWIETADTAAWPGFEKLTTWLITNKAQLAPGEAGQLLEKLIEHPINNLPPQDKPIFDLLEQQGVQLSPQKAVELQQQLIAKQSTSLPAFNQSNERTFELLKKYSTHLTPQQASELLNYLTWQLVGAYPEKSLPEPLEMEMIDFLKSQKGIMPPATALAILEVIKEALPPVLEDLVLPSIQQDKTPIEPSKATRLLQEAVEKKQGSKVYKLLLDKGASPNDIQIKGLPLLHYAMSTPDFKELFDELIKNDHTDINVVDQATGFTVPMKIADLGGHNEKKFPQGLFDTMNTLLQRKDLDINTIHGNNTDTKSYTLLDLIIRACMQPSPGGHDDQINTANQCNAKWLEILKIVKKDYNFEITPDNIEKAQRNFTKAAVAQYDKEAKAALDVVKIPIPDEKRIKELWEEILTNKK